MAWASIRNETVKQKMDAVMSVLSECQKKIGTGYLSAFPSELFDRLENLVYVWAPYYTIHKVKFLLNICFFMIKIHSWN